MYLATRNICIMLLCRRARRIRPRYARTYLVQMNGWPAEIQVVLQYSPTFLMEESVRFDLGGMKGKHEDNSFFLVYKQMATSSVPHQKKQDVPIHGPNNDIWASHKAYLLFRETSVLIWILGRQGQRQHWAWAGTSEWHSQIPTLCTVCFHWLILFINPHPPT